MSDAITFGLILIGLVVIAVSLRFILRQLKSEREEEAAREEIMRKNALESQKHKNYLTESVRILAHALLHDEKITLTEGCIRLKVMIDNLEPSLHQHDDLDVIEEVYNRTAHIPYLEAWKSLERKQQRQFEREMRAIEQECEARIKRAAQTLLDMPLARLH